MHRLCEHQSGVTDVLGLSPAGTEFSNQIARHIKESTPSAQHGIEGL